MSILPTPRAFGRISVMSAAVMVLLLAWSHAAFAQAQGSLGAVRAAMAAKQYDTAAELADVVVAANPKDADEARYLKALALYYGDKPAVALTAVDELVAKHPNSPWLRKARFLKAMAYTKQRDFKPAEAIYDAEAHRLLSDARKQEIAGVLIGFADALAKEPDPNDPAAPGVYF